MPYIVMKEILEKALPYGGLGALGGIALQLNQIRKGEKFKWGMIITNILLSAWIGIIIGPLLPDSLGNVKFSLISISGFISYPILDLLEKKGLSLILKKILGGK